MKENTGIIWYQKKKFLRQNPFNVLSKQLPIPSSSSLTHRWFTTKVSVTVTSCSVTRWFVSLSSCLVPSVWSQDSPSSSNGSKKKGACRAITICPDVTQSAVPILLFAPLDGIVWPLSLASEWRISQFL